MFSDSLSFTAKLTTFHKAACLSVLESYFFRVANVSSFKPNKVHVLHVLLFLLNQKVNESENRRILVETYGDKVLMQVQMLAQGKHHYRPQNLNHFGKKSCIMSNSEIR